MEDLPDQAPAANLGRRFGTGSQVILTLLVVACSALMMPERPPYCTVYKRFLKDAERKEGQSMS